VGDGGLEVTKSMIRPAAIVEGACVIGFVFDDLAKFRNGVIEFTPGRKRERTPHYGGGAVRIDGERLATIAYGVTVLSRGLVDGGPPGVEQGVSRIGCQSMRI